ncbi:MAG: response regulator [Deltaproteobacteria bacterium]|nr:response regulator [Deltaproteobacteria bacterium]MBW1961098.1 response regulator [Deltaproteobacteria bacterium]MBW2150484.1 response regulator [Deltaproteobacteria bacterium]
MFQIKNLNKKATGALILFIGLGFLGNYYSIPLFYGVDFLFGSIAALIVLCIYGIGWGLLTVIAGSIYTYFLWGHPYAALIFISEIGFVGYLVHQKQKNLLLVDGIFWLVAGIPMIYLFYHTVMQMDTVATTLIMLKQSINGIFNALVASFAVEYLRIHKLMSMRIVKEGKISLNELLFNLLVAVVLIPALVITVLDGREEIKRIENTVISSMTSLSTDLRKHLGYWYSQHLHAVKELARLAGQTSMVPSEELQRNVEAVKRGFPDFHNMHVADLRATTIAFYPPVNRKGESTIGLNFSDTLFFPAARQEVLRETMQLNVKDYMGGGQTILVVDDVKEQREIASSMLNTLGYTVETVGSGEEAVEYIKDNHVDLVVLDMIMDPGMDGLDTYRKILEKRPNQKAIIVSGFAETDRVREALSLGAGGYVRKPYTLAGIGMAVKAEIERKRITVSGAT